MSKERPWMKNPRKLRKITLKQMLFFFLLFCGFGGKR
jgi:hypothetical protein